MSPPSEIKCHIEPQWLGKIKVCLNGCSHMTKLAIMPMHGESFKILSRTKWLMALNLDSSIWDLFTVRFH